MSEEQIKNMIKKQCLELTTNNDFRPPISAIDGVDIDDVVRVCKQLQDKKTYIDLLKENQKYKEVIEKIKTRYCDYYGTKKEINDDCVLRNVLKEISDILKEVE